MSGYLKKIKLSCFLIDKVLIYQLSFMLLVLPNLVLFPLSVPLFGSS